MEAKDTKFKCLGCGQLVTPTQNHPIECCESFKAGRESAFKEMLGLPQDMKVYQSENIVDEKSYKAGYEQALKDYGINDDDRPRNLIEILKSEHPTLHAVQRKLIKESKKEVVDWILNHAVIMGRDTDSYFELQQVSFNLSRWQAQLKEWGINETKE